MLTIIQAQAILSILIAFGVPQITVNKVHDILIPSNPIEIQAPTPITITQTTQVIPTTTNPSTNLEGVNNSPTPTPTVVESKSMVDIVIPEPRVYPASQGNPYGHLLFVGVSVLDENGANKFLADVSMNDGDGVIIEQQTNTQSGTNKGDWTATFSYAPKSAGDKILTFTSGDLTKTYNYKGQ